LAPTILHLLGEAVPAIMDGRILEEALIDPVPVRFVAGVADELRDEQDFNTDEADQIEERLRGLGYL
jgi:hypothetical protein